MKSLLILIIFTPALIYAQQSEQGTLVLRKKHPNVELMSEAIDGEVFTIVENMPEFPGGRNALLNYMSENIKYPNEAKNKNISGKVYVQFVVKSDGTIDNVRVLQGKNKLLDQEAIRVVKSMPNWTPGRQSGRTVDVVYNLPVTFILN